jgi:lysylphosphatidylglycerol synthetase-like protein (DUF2156 family)
MMAHRHAHALEVATAASEPVVLNLDHHHCETVHSTVDQQYCDATVEELSHKEARTILSLDNLGIAASSLCLVHCLAMPFLIAALPFLGLQFLEGNFAHRLLAGFVIAFALFAVLPGYLKHRRKTVLAAMCIGLSLVLFATFGVHHEQWELRLISIGNLILVGTHLRNRGLLKCDHVH